MDGFADDVLPVLEKHCLRCHSEGGPTPMSLGTYREARPWAESIKEQVLERGMPPLFVEHGSARVENGSPLTGRELDILVDWASGGAPEGSRAASKERGAGAESTPRRADDPAEGGADPDALQRHPRRAVVGIPLQGIGVLDDRTIEIRPALRLLGQFHRAAAGAGGRPEQAARQGDNQRATCVSGSCHR